jgi:anthranilate 1,2-dioxygenase large subunit
MRVEDMSTTAMNPPSSEGASSDDRSAMPFDWPTEGVTRVPFQVFSDPAVYKMEQKKIFRGPVWHFLCLVLDLKETGDYRTSFIGDNPIIVVRDREGNINGMVNRCAHKGALVCHKERGNAKALSCLYHSWTDGPTDGPGVP